MPAAPVTLSSNLQSLIVPGVIAAEMRGPGDAAALLPAELEFVARAAPKRVAEFAAGRQCARRALAEFGIRNFALRAAKDRQPVWPEGMVGTITHSAGLCIAAVAEGRRFVALGLDCEVNGAPSRDIWPTVCRDSELSWIESLPEAEQAAAVTLVFSAKEAFYKAQYPVTGEWLDFHDLNVEPAAWGECQSAFEVRATRRIGFEDRAALPVSGRYVFADGFVVTSVVLPASA